MKKKIRLVIADDHAMFRSGLRVLLEKHPDMEIVGEAANGSESVQAARDSRPDLLLLDISMPGMTVHEVIREVRRESPETRILAVTMHAEPALADAVLADGAAGFIVKTASHDELTSAIRAVHEGRTFVDAGPGCLSLDGAVEHLARDMMLARGRSASLSRREQEVLGLLVRGLTNRQIAVRLRVGESTVETYRSRLARKLGLKSRQDFIRLAMGGDVDSQL